MQQPYCLQLMSEPRLAAAHGTGVRLKLLRNTQHLCLGGCKLCPHAFSPFRRFFLLLCFLCQQSLGPVVSDQLHRCLTNGLDHSMPCMDHVKGWYPQVRTARREDHSQGDFCTQRVMICTLVWENKCTLLCTLHFHSHGGLREEEFLSGEVL